ncbi:MAG: DUF4349 domain-containing protein [Saprospiraceae bacterium]
MKKYYFLLSLLFSIAACQESPSYSKETSMLEAQEVEEEAAYFDQEMEVPRTAEPPPPPPASDESEQSQKIRKSIEKGSKIIKDGNLKVAVDELKKTKTEVDTILKKFKAYYENENYTSGTYRSTYHLNIRVPSKNFEGLLKAIEIGNGKILEKNISARDVTDQYVDIAIRLDNNKTYLGRYRALLSKANSIKDILEIQEKIRRIEEEIDSRTGRLKYMDDQVRFSTLRLELFQEHEVIATKKNRNFVAQLATAFTNGIHGFLDFALFLMSIWPFILMMGLIWIFRKRISWRFWRKGK